MSVNNDTQKGNVREGSSRGSLDEGSGKVQHASTPMWQYSRICLCSEWSQFLRRSECHRPAQSREMSRKRLPGGPWRKVLGRFKKRALTPCEREQQRTKGKCQRRFFQGVTGGRFQESSKRQTHIVGSVLIYVCVLDGNVTVDNIDAATLRNQGKCQRRVFQGVPGGKFWEG